MYNRWKGCDEFKILNEYAGQPIEKVPEEYREQITKLRQYGVKGKKLRTSKGITESPEKSKSKKRTSKEIAEASISELKNVEDADAVYGTFEGLVEKKRNNKRRRSEK